MESQLTGTSSLLLTIALHSLYSQIHIFTVRRKSYNICDYFRMGDEEALSWQRSTREKSDGNGTKIRLICIPFEFLPMRA